MKTLAFIKAFERFTARRGTPDVIINDNFKTFKSSVFKKIMLRLGVRQKFILPVSPGWGGFFKRLVRSVKMSLEKILGKSLLSYEELGLLCFESNQLYKCCPLAYLSEDYLGDALTPNHLIYS